MLLNCDENAKIVIESELRSNVRFLAPMNVSLRYWSPFHRNECVFSRNEQQKVYKSTFCVLQSSQNDDKNTCFDDNFQKAKNILLKQLLLKFKVYLF